ncbi:conserved Plasmodium protein, unknown function [Plasmodium ovale]|uniref:Uncharacterized protein n=2 Tax=Plasmodium ovale TaxID=36330 RepID=A0A1C3KQ14_PLAOA|nr:conserved Plasmodium protein, unknown function [Plasmodium ovale]
MEKSSTNETMVLTLKNLGKSKWSSLSKKKVEEKTCYSPRTEKLIDVISPILDYYGYNKEDVYNFISLYEFDIEQIQSELCNIMESKEENNEGLWETVKSKKNKKTAEKSNKKNNLMQQNMGRKNYRPFEKIFPKGFNLKKEGLRKNKSTLNTVEVGQHKSVPNNKVMHVVHSSAKNENVIMLNEGNKKFREEYSTKEKKDIEENSKKHSREKAATIDVDSYDAARNVKNDKVTSVKSKKGKKSGSNENYENNYLNNFAEEGKNEHKKNKNVSKEHGGAGNDEHFVKNRENVNKKSSKNSYNSNSNSNNNNSHVNHFEKKKHLKLEDGKEAGYNSSDDHSSKKESKNKGAASIGTSGNTGPNGVGVGNTSTNFSRYNNFNYNDKYFNKSYNRYSKPLNDSLVTRSGKQRFHPFNNKSSVYSSGNSYFSSYAKGNQKKSYLNNQTFRKKRSTSKNNSTDLDYDSQTGQKEKYSITNNEHSSGNDNYSGNHDDKVNNNSDKKKSLGAKGAIEKTNNTSYASVVNNKTKQTSSDDTKNAEMKRKSAHAPIPSNDNAVDDEKKDKKKNKCQLIPINNNKAEKLWVSVITKGSSSNNAHENNEKVDNLGIAKNDENSSKELKNDQSNQQVNKKGTHNNKSVKTKKKENAQENMHNKNLAVENSGNNEGSNNNSSICKNNESKKLAKDMEKEEEARESKGALLSHNKVTKKEVSVCEKGNKMYVEVDGRKGQQNSEMKNNVEKEKYVSESGTSKKETRSSRKANVEGAKGKANESKTDVEEKKKKKKKKPDQENALKDSNASVKLRSAGGISSHELKKGKNKMNNASNNNINISSGINGNNVKMMIPHEEKVIPQHNRISDDYGEKQQNNVPIYMPNLSLLSSDISKKIFFGNINITGNQIENIDVSDSKIEYMKNNHFGSSSNSSKIVNAESKKRNNLRKNYYLDAEAIDTNNEVDSERDSGHGNASAWLCKEGDDQNYEGHYHSSHSAANATNNTNGTNNISGSSTGHSSDMRSQKEREMKHYDFKNKSQKREDHGNHDMLSENKHKSLFSSSNNKHAHVNTKSHNLYIPKITTTSASSVATAAGTTSSSHHHHHHHHHHQHQQMQSSMNSTSQSAKHLLNSSSSMFMNNQSSSHHASPDNSSASALISGKNSKYVQSTMKNKNYDQDVDDSSSLQLNQISQKFLQSHQNSGNNKLSTCNANNSVTNNNGSNSNSNSIAAVGTAATSASASVSVNANVNSTVSASNTISNMSNKNTNTDVSNLNLINMGMNNLSNNNMYNSYNSPPGLANQFNYSFTNLSYPYNNMHYNGYTTQTLVPQYGLINNHYNKNNSIHNNNFNYNMNYDNFDENNLYAHSNNMHMNNYVNFMNVNVKKNQLNTDDDNLSNSGEVSISGSLQQQNLTFENQNSSNQNSGNMSNSCMDTMNTMNTNGINNLSLNNMNSNINPNLNISCGTSSTSELKNKQQFNKSMNEMQRQSSSVMQPMKQNQGSQNKSGNMNSNQHTQSKHTGHQQNLMNSNSNNNSNNNNSLNHFTQNQINPNTSQNTASSTSSSLTGKVETNNLNSTSQNTQSNYLNKQLYHNSNYYNINSNNYNIPPGFNMSQEKEQTNNYLNNNVTTTNSNSSVAAYRNNWNSINEKNLNHYNLNYNYNRSNKNNFNYTSNLNYNSSNGYNGTRDNTNTFFNYNNFSYALQTPPGLQTYYQNTQYQQQNNYNNRSYNYSGYNNNLSMWNREE